MDLAPVPDRIFGDNIEGLDGPFPQRNSMFSPKCSQLPCMNIEVSKVDQVGMTARLVACRQFQ
jgi:hypothetical protein